MTAYRTVIRVHRPECLRCGHLVEFASDRQTDCHFERGNDDCPARALVVAVDADQHALVRLIASAQQSGDWAELASLMKQVDSLPADQRAFVLNQGKSASATNERTEPGKTGTAK